MSGPAASTAAAVRVPGLRQIVSDYVEMTKPKVQSLLLFTTVTTMYVAGGLLLCQVLVGALNVWLDEYEALILLHLALGTLLWATLAGLTFQLYRVPAPADARAGASRAEAVAA